MISVLNSHSASILHVVVISCSHKASVLWASPRSPGLDSPPLGRIRLLLVVRGRSPVSALLQSPLKSSRVSECLDHCLNFLLGSIDSRVFIATGWVGGWHLGASAWRRRSHQGWAGIHPGWRCSLSDGTAAIVSPFEPWILFGLGPGPRAHLLVSFRISRCSRGTCRLRRDMPRGLLTSIVSHTK